MPVQPGKSLLSYEIVRELGRGGMATVYLARQPAMNRSVAIKALPEHLLHDPNFLNRFKNEAQVIARLEHRGILPVYDFGEADGVPFIVMRYMPAGSLDDRLAAYPEGLPLAEVVELIGQIAEALDFAHGQGIIHRDLKPDNVLLDEQGNAFLADFGIAKVLEATAATSGTMIAGTPSYMAPEQAQGQIPSARSDVYALGAMTFELLAGRPPFVSDDPMVLMFLHLNEPTPSLRQYRPDAPAAFQAVIARAMAKAPEDRFPSAGALAAALIQAQNGPPDDPTTPYPAGSAGTDWPETVIETTDWPETMVDETPVMGAASVVPATKVAPPPNVRGRAPVAVAGLLLISCLVLLGLGVAGVALFQFLGGPTATPDVVALATTAAPAQTEPAGTATTATGLAIDPAPTRARPTATALATATAAQPPTATALPARITQGDSTLILVPAGPFLMGGAPDVGAAVCAELAVDFECPSGFFDDEGPAHTVDLSPFYIDQFEVSNEAYAACVTAGRCRPPQNEASQTRGTYYGNPRFGNYPVVHMTWADADSFCQWRGARLPTEAEWEKAARGTDGRLYPWGGQFGSDLGNFCDEACEFEYANTTYSDGYFDTAPVDSYANGISPVGAYNMSGNVWEWVADWYDPLYYQTSPAADPMGPAGGSLRVIRGGAWINQAYLLRTMDRGAQSPIETARFIGFRCAWTP